jgi:hypothetical protein
VLVLVIGGQRRRILLPQRIKKDFKEDSIEDHSPHTKSIPYRNVARYNEGLEMMIERCLCALALARWMRLRCESVMILPGCQF